MKTVQLNLKRAKKISIAPINPKIKVSKWVYTLLLLIFSTVSLFAQGGDIDSQLQIWGEQIQTTLNIVVGIFAIVGGFIVFIQYMQGNEQAQRNFIRFVIGLAIFGLVTLIANVFIPTGGTT